MGRSNTIGGGVVGVLREVEALGLADDRLALGGGGRPRGHRPRARGAGLPHDARRRWPGADPSGSEAAVRKLLGVQHDQHVQEVGMSLMGPEAAATDGEAGGLVGRVPLQPVPHDRRRHERRAANVIAERLLGLPRDPEPGQ